MKVVFLLGSGYPPSQMGIRRSVKRSMNCKKIQAIIMEDIHPKPKKNMHILFSNIIKSQKPDLIVAMYTKSGHSNGVDFELGVLTCPGLFPPERLVIMIQKNMNKDRIPAYVAKGLQTKSNTFSFKTPADAGKKIASILNHLDYRRKDFQL